MLNSGNLGSDPSRATGVIIDLLLSLREKGLTPDFQN